MEGRLPRGSLESPPMSEDRLISLNPRWHRRVWSLAKSGWRAFFQIAVVLAALTFLQGQQPVLDRSIDHGSKILSIGRAGFSPLYVRIFGVEFFINFDRDAAGHELLNATKPISGFGTRGFLYQQTLWLPWSKIRLDLQGLKNLSFDEWRGDFPSPYGVYCFEIEARNVLSNQLTVEPVLTPSVKLSASLFGPMGTAEVVGSYPNVLLVAEAQIKSDCHALYEEMR